MIRIFFLNLVLLITGSLFAIIQPKEIKCTTNYVQPETYVNFPISFGQFIRTRIYSFDNQQTNIGVTYKDRDGLTITVYVYPANEGMEDRLRSQFLYCLQQISVVANRKLRPNMQLASYSNDGYKINGLRAAVSQNNSHSFLWVYECGEWFFKIRITTNPFVTNSNAEQIQKGILNQFVPTELVKVAPLKPRAIISMAAAAFKDSLMLGCQLNSAFAKSDWAFEHIDSLERVSGFPGLYLDLQVEGLKKTLEFAREHPAMPRNASTDEYLSELNLINNNGFLREFIHDQFIVPMIEVKDTTMNFEAYSTWKNKHPLKISLEKMYYLLYYDTQTKKKSLADTVSVLDVDKLDSCVNAGFDSLQINNYLIVTKIDEANADYIQILCNRLKDSLIVSGSHVRILYCTKVNADIWTDIAQKSKVSNMVLLMPDEKYHINTFSGFGKPIVSIKRAYTVRVIDRKTNNSINKKMSISYKDDHIEKTVEKAYINIRKIQESLYTNK